MPLSFLPDSLPGEADVVICGSGTAGLCAALWLARCGINFIILERRDERLKIGQADGVQCRTIEILESFGIAHLLLKEAYHVFEVAFWSGESRDNRGIIRTRFAADTEKGMSHQPHVILNQARIHDILIEEIIAATGYSEGKIYYGYDVQDVAIDQSQAADHTAHCVTVSATKDDQTHIVKGRYVLACDGAHSSVRRSLGFKMVGDTSDMVWGVIDTYPRTNFPDVRKKSVISSTAGSLLIIPREGDSMVRMYIELGYKWASRVTLDEIQDRARLILHPYHVEFAETSWWSAYAIGQRVANHFTQDNRVFLTGDACHTHSPKAGQGMNASLQDGHNIGWKLAAALKGWAKNPLQMMASYVQERQAIAHELIEFDRFFTSIFSSEYRKQHGVTAAYFSEQFVKAGRYTAGQSLQYKDPYLTQRSARNPSTKVKLGGKFPSAQLTRFCDGRPVQLLGMLPADGRFHIVIFAGDIKEAASFERLCEVSEELEFVRQRFTPPQGYSDAMFNFVLVLSGQRHSIDQDMIPELYSPSTGKRNMKLLTNIFVDDESYATSHGHAYEKYGVTPELGLAVVVRPDQYVSKMTMLDDAYELSGYFEEILTSYEENQ